ncbi:MAG: OadG family protein [Clostridiales bacterium]|nr:OadG family protein [Clostridiales bacterium]
MTIGERLLLGFNTTVIAMTIVFVVLIFLGFCIRAITLIVEKLKLDNHSTPKNVEIKNKKVDEVSAKHAETTGTSAGEITITSDITDDEFAVLVAVVAHELKKPLEEVKIKSIKLLDK